MKIAILSDIHGNSVSLSAVLRQLANEACDQIVCLGDTTYGPDPIGVLQMLGSANAIHLKGNGDAWNVDPELVAPDVERLVQQRRRRGNENALSSLDAATLIRYHHELNGWLRRQLAGAGLELLASFALTHRVDLGDGQALLCFHGSPRDYIDFFLPSADETDLDPMFASETANVMVGGHTHHQMVRRYKGSWLVNAGSVGLPRLPPYGAAPGEEPVRPAIAEYVVVEARDGSVEIGLRHVRVNADAVMRLVRDSGMPLADWYYGRWAP